MRLWTASSILKTETLKTIRVMLFHRACSKMLPTSQSPKFPKKTSVKPKTPAKKDVETKWTCKNRTTWWDNHNNKFKNHQACKSNISRNNKKGRDKCPVVAKFQNFCNKCNNQRSLKEVKNQFQWLTWWRFTVKSTKQNLKNLVLKGSATCDVRGFELTLFVCVGGCWLGVFGFVQSCVHFQNGRACMIRL